MTAWVPAPKNAPRFGIEPFMHALPGGPEEVLTASVEAQPDAASKAMSANRRTLSSSTTLEPLPRSLYHKTFKMKPNDDVYHHGSPLQKGSLFTGRPPHRVLDRKFLIPRSSNEFLPHLVRFGRGAVDPAQHYHQTQVQQQIRTVPLYSA